MGLPKYLRPVAVLLAAASLFAGCAGGSGDDTAGEPGGDQSTQGERTEVVKIVPVDSGSGGGGAKEPRVLIADSLESFGDIRDLGSLETTAVSENNSTYIAALWGEKRTGGYTVGVESARLSGETVTVVLRLEEPPEGAIVSQAITYPYAVFGLAGVDPATTEFVFEDRDGRELDWPVRNLSGS